ncbi:MAG: class I SAM-dependent methyltransferase [Patescibacteria group bacterium]|mgnify:CR=1 FL=1
MKREALATEVATVVESYIPHVRGDEADYHVLDIAAGTGIVSQALAGEGFNVTATDVSTKALGALRQQSPTIATEQADMNQGLPFADSSFDGATSVWANRFIADTPFFLEEVHRVLKEGGVFIWPIFPTEIPFWKKEQGLRQPTRPGKLSELAQEAGFSGIKTVRRADIDDTAGKLPFHSRANYLILTK